jgi:hypothetical protein
MITRGLSHSFSRRYFMGLLVLGAGSAATTMPGAGRVWHRHYRAQAVVLFCGVPIFSKSGVGGGYAVAEEAVRGEFTEVSLQFAGGSWPDKAHGVNRLGFIQETILEKPGGEPVEAQYFGFMTSSGEKNFEQAKQSLTESGAKPVPYTATQGTARDGKFLSTIYRMFFPPSRTWADCPALIHDVRANLEHSEAKALDSVQCPAANTFLNTLRHALLNPALKTEASLVYNGKLYDLQTEKQDEPNGNVRLSGTLQEKGTSQKTPFRLWHEKDSANFLPVRIEYRAKSFLKLVFDKENA